MGKEVVTDLHLKYLINLSAHADWAGDVIYEDTHCYGFTVEGVLYVVKPADAEKFEKLHNIPEEAF